MKYHCSINFIRVLEMLCIILYIGYATYIGVYEYTALIYKYTTVIYWKWFNLTLMVMMGFLSVRTFSYISEMSS